VSQVIAPNNAMAFGQVNPRQDGGTGVRFDGATAASLLAGDRYQEIQRRQAYYDCTQHDGKHWDFDGRPVSPRTTQPLLGMERSWWVPLKMRRPSMTYRLGKIIVDAFTALLFGENRFPTIRVEGDDQTEDLYQTIARVGKLPQKMIQARNLGGGSGTVGISWCFRDGKPRFEVHNAKHLFVHKWKDRLDLIPLHVSEVYLFSKPKWDGRAFTKQWYWFRRDWMPEADIIFHEVSVDPDPNVEITWVVDEEKSNFHQDGVCHLQWIQNMPSDDQDGLPDYTGLYEVMDGLDLLKSVITRGATLNLDPTVVLKMDRDEVGRMGIQKGSDNGLVVGKDGDANYMELGGQSIEAGLKLIETVRRSALECAQCIVPDPHEVAAQGVSSVAVKTMYAPMLAKADILREQYGSAIERMFNDIGEVLKKKLKTPVELPDASDPAASQPPADASASGSQSIPPEASASASPSASPSGSASTPVDASTSASGSASKPKKLGRFVLDLPKKVEKKPLLDPVDDVDNGEERTHKTDRTIGDGEGEISLTWAPYFPPTPADQSSIATALTTMTGGQAVLSQETAVEAAARAYGADPAEEWKKVQAEAKDAADKQQAMMGGDPGGKVGAKDQLPPGATPKPKPAPKPPGGMMGADPNDPDQRPADVDLTGGAPPPAAA